RHCTTCYCSPLPSSFYLCSLLSVFVHHTSTTYPFSLSLHDALPISPTAPSPRRGRRRRRPGRAAGVSVPSHVRPDRCPRRSRYRSEEHTSELQSRFDLVCRLLLEKKNEQKARIESGCGNIRDDETTG